MHHPAGPPSHPASGVIRPPFAPGHRANAALLRHQASHPPTIRHMDGLTGLQSHHSPLQ